MIDSFVWCCLLFFDDLSVTVFIRYLLSFSEYLYLSNYCRQLLTTIFLMFSSPTLAVVDILDIKWESLIQDTRPKPAMVPGSALQRFTAASIFKKIGVSTAFAGSTLLKKVKITCQRQVEELASKAVEAENENTEPDEGSVVAVL